MPRPGLCSRCLTSVDPATDGAGKLTLCCSKCLCMACFDMCVQCPVCRATLLKTGAAAAARIEPPPYVPDTVREAPPPADAEPPAYDDRHATPLVPASTLASEGSSSSALAVPARDTAEIVVDPVHGVMVVHYISNRDTLVGIGLKYDVSIDLIKRANKMFSNNIHEHEKLLIPGVKNLPKTVTNPTDEMMDERHRQRLTKRFQLTTKCVDPSEAQFYMEDCDFDIDLAIARYTEDMQWEQAHPLPPGHTRPRQHRSRTAAPASAAAPTAQAPSGTRSTFFRFTAALSRRPGYTAVNTSDIDVELPVLTGEKTAVY